MAPLTELNIHSNKSLRGPTASAIHSQRHAEREEERWRMRKSMLYSGVAFKLDSFNQGSNNQGSSKYVTANIMQTLMFNRDEWLSFPQSGFAWDAAGFALWELSVKLSETPFELLRSWTWVRNALLLGVERKVAALELNKNENLEEESEKSRSCPPLSDKWHNFQIEKIN